MPPKGLPLLSSKEDTNVREALKLYESKQFKKALKLIDINLRRSPSHPESCALKACIAQSLGGVDPVLYMDRATKAAPDNYLVAHLAAIFYRHRKQYPLASKWLAAAVANGAPNKALLLELASLQVYNREYASLRRLRQAIVESYPGYRCNWTALAVSHHLAGDPSAAASTLASFEKIVTPHLLPSDNFEHSECILYKCTVLADSGDFKGALDAIDAAGPAIRDCTAANELRAKFSLLAGQTADSVTAYRSLLIRNPDNVNYYVGLETALGTSARPSTVRLQLYDKLATIYPKSDPPQFLPLLFLNASHPEFAPRAGKYIETQLRRGIPATFANVKPLYASPAKRKVIEELVSAFYNGAADRDPSPAVKVWTAYFLAQHFLLARNLPEALRYIDEAIAHTPTLVELYIVRSRILKHDAKLSEAADQMTKGRSLDLQDRFINSKTVKYLLRANRVDEAFECISAFASPSPSGADAATDAVADARKVGPAQRAIHEAHTMQNNWVLTESAEAYARLYRERLDELAMDEAAPGEDPEILRGLALKRYHAVVDNFNTFKFDQYDFYPYCMRRGTARDFVATLKWADKLPLTPVYTRVLRGLADLYLKLHDDQKKLSVDKATTPVKRNKKVAMAAAKRQTELSARVSSSEKDNDPLGQNQVASIIADGILKLLHDLVQPLSDAGKNLRVTWEVLFGIYLLEGKYVLALTAIKNLNKVINPFDEYKPRQIGIMVATLLETVRSDTDANKAIATVIEKATAIAFPDVEGKSLDEFKTIYCD